VGGILWMMISGFSKSTESTTTSAAAGLEGEADQAVLDPHDLSGFKGSLNLMQKKQEVQRALAVDMMALPEDRKISAAAFDEYWNHLLEPDREEKSAEELKTLILKEHESN
jgi:hypothetical protein